MIGVSLVGRQLDFWQKKEIARKKTQEKKKQRAEAAKDLDEAVAKKKKDDPLRDLLDFGHASMVGEREGEEYYKPVFMDKEDIQKHPVSVL